MMLSSPVVATNYSHLCGLVKDAIKRHGDRCSLNHIDISRVQSLDNMFSNSRFTGSIARWNTKNVLSMRNTFNGSHFNGDLTAWNVAKVEDMTGMFEHSRFNKNISMWNVGRVKRFEQMFVMSRFGQDLSKWRIGEDANTQNMIQHNFSGWLPCDITATQWFSLRACHFEESSTFLPGMTWWLYLSQSKTIPTVVPQTLHAWLENVRMQGRELEMPTADLAQYLALSYPMNEVAKAQFNALVRREYSIRCAIVELMKPPPDLADETWEPSSTALARRRFQAILGAQPDVVVPPETYDLPKM